MNSSSILCTVHLRPGTVAERLVDTRSQVSLYAGRFRIDKLEVLNFGFISPSELDEAYDQIVDAARAANVTDGATEDLRNFP